MPTRNRPLAFALLAALAACKRDALSDHCVAADRTVPATSAHPLAIEPERVGTYPTIVKSGGGYLWDDVLEYRVWLQLEGGDTYHAFASYEAAAAFSSATPSAERPLVLVRQREWINEPEPGRYVHERSTRLTEWQVDWLADSHRGPESIAEFLAHPRPGRESPPTPR